MKKEILNFDSLVSSSLLCETLDGKSSAPTHIVFDAKSSKDPSKSLLTNALDDDSIRDLIMMLASRGYYAYRHVDGKAKFVKHEYACIDWKGVRENGFKADENHIIYKFEPAVNGKNQRLLVIFSPVNSSVKLDRYVWPSFSTAQKFLVPGTAVLRIGDFGGVKGAFYLNTTYVPDNEKRISDLIRRIATFESISKENILLYGPSKGGTAALYHGLSNGWKFVSVDPIVSDEWYENNERDYHFTSGNVFPCTKQEVFADVVQRTVEGALPRLLGGCVVTSWRSPQYDYIGEALTPLAESMTIFDSGNPEIKKHPDVAPKTLSVQVMAMNALLLGLDLPKSMTEVP